MLTKDSFKNYREVDAVNASLLKDLRKSPLNAFGMPEKEDTQSLSFGRLYHEFVLESQDFNSRYYLYDESKRPEPNKNFNSSKNKEWKANILKANEGKTAVSALEKNILNKMLRNLIKYCSLAVNFLESSELEISCYTDLEIFDNILPVKCRFDAINVERGAIMDLKTTKDASPDGFSREAGKYAYHIQAAFYTRIAEKVFNKPFKFFYLTQETQSPYNVLLREVSPAMIAKGNMELKELLKAAYHIRQTGELQSYNVFSDNEAGIVPLDIPDFYVSKNKFNFDNNNLAIA